MNMRRLIFPGIVSIFLLWATAWNACAADDLTAGFVNPPDSARPHTWWHWMDGNITREGITLDLEAMKQAGVGGAQIFNVSCGIPAGPVDFMSPEWRMMMKHAIQEADRLGLTLCLHNCAGWSSSGGPWITPDLAMQFVTWADTIVEGPAHIELDLPVPNHKLDFYRDIALLAFPMPEGEDWKMKEHVAKITTGVELANPDAMIDGNTGTMAILPKPSAKTPQYIQFEFTEAFAPRTLSITPSTGHQAHSGALQASDDGVVFRTIMPVNLPDTETGRHAENFAVETAPARFFRLTFDKGDTRATRLTLGEINLTPQVILKDWHEKTGVWRVENPARDTRTSIPASCAVTSDKVMDISAHMDASGKLTWEAPAGKWTILRFGYTPTGKTNHPAAKSGLGLECDKMSAEAAAFHWAHAVQPILDDIGPLAGKSLKHILIDSYEVHCQNWTPAFREEFTKRRGYDLLHYLPAMTGRFVDGVDTTERFLWDVRRTIADLYADNYFGAFRTLCHDHGLELAAEPYGDGNFDDLTAGAAADLPMTEFWVGSSSDPAGGKLASSIAHTHGLSVVGAESFTASNEVGRWLTDAFAIKGLGDAMYCGGVNRFIFHRYAHQPWTDKLPGMTMGPWGMHFERTLTWWQQGSAWLKYLARCQYLLQSGEFVGDACYYTGEGSPTSLPGRGGLSPVLPEGYDYDGIDTSVLSNLMEVQDGDIVLKSGMRYRFLALPPRTAMSPAVLRRIEALVNAGAIVTGQKPTASPSLTDYPACDSTVQEIAEKLWGSCDGKTVLEHAYGKGRVIWGKEAGAVLEELGVAPDFICEKISGDVKPTYIHRREKDMDWYFVACRQPKGATLECSFRITGKAPELWHPDSGLMEPAPIWREKDGRTHVTFHLDSNGAVFVVFRRAADAQEHFAAAYWNGGDFFAQQTAKTETLEITKAEYGVFNEAPPQTINLTEKVARLVSDNAVTVCASNAFAGNDPAFNVLKQMRIDYAYAGKEESVTLDENQTLRLPETPVKDGILEIRKALYGALPDEDQPASTVHKVDITQKLASLMAANTLTVSVNNQLVDGVDPAPMIVKQLYVEYRLDGKPYTKLVGENSILELPEGMAPQPCVADILTRDDGRLAIQAFTPGTYAFDCLSGNAISMPINDIPAPVEITGPWKVQFEPGHGAPESVTLDTLISWPDHENPGVKYFSGRAVYTKDIELPDTAFAADRTLTLNLGRLANFAEVRVNGQDLGILWKPPYTVEATGALKPGMNHLEIAITNLWPNRLIGDEQLPDDCEWNPDGSLKEWPQWFVKGEPRPSSGRVTFTTWKHFQKNSPLLESGMIGPVTVRTAVVRDIK